LGWGVKRLARPYRAGRWRQLLPDPAACLLIARSLNLSPVTAQVLYNRGLTTPEAAHAFLTAGREQILDPFLLKDMDKAVTLIRARIAAGRPIMVYGDYDVDGVTGTTILVLALRAMGAAVEYYIPNRFDEGYGLNVGALKEIRERGHDFVLSVDTGVSAVAEAEAAVELGITLIISDHHEPGPVLPDVPALINPKRADCSYPFKGLSGVGVAFKLALALEAPGAWDLIDIVTLGTIADMVPLVGENRAIVREGMTALGSTRRPGLRP
jgi:single-stranded-DNA-specific exonuclease